MVAASLLAAAVLAGGQDAVAGVSIDLIVKGEAEPRMNVRMRHVRLDPPKVSPQHKWTFEWVAAGFGSPTVGTDMALRFRVYSQLRRERDDLSPQIARTGLRLWDYNVKRLKLDHSPTYNNGIIDVYLCFGGEAGGEQRFDEDVENGFYKKVNTIYLYQIFQLDNRLEMLREFAHEYGHATLPPIGGFETPEDWGNGFLGERIYMKWLRDDMAAERLGPHDALGVSLPELDKWIGVHVDPLWKKVAANGPDHALLGGKGQQAMNAYLGLALYAEQVLPRDALARAFRLTGSVSAADFDDAIVTAACEQPTRTLNIPKAFIKKPIWIPMLAGSKVSGATAKQRKGSWVLVIPAGPTIKLTNPQP